MVTAVMAVLTCLYHRRKLLSRVDQELRYLLWELILRGRDRGTGEYDDPS